jgi:glycosyl transferase family 11
VIAVDRRGRLGNHLFQWAFAVSASRRLGTRFAMEHDSLSPLFELDGYTRLPRKFRRKLWLAHDRLQPRPVIEVTNEASPSSVLVALHDGVRYTGFFQSADYFSGHSDAVLRALTVRPEHRRHFEQRHKDLADQDYVCVHVRRGDYLTWRNGAALPWSYVERCLKLVDEGAPVIFLSDDIAAVQAKFGSYPNARFEADDLILDLQLMIHAKACVVSNSSFAWWGAWLNRTPDKRVLAPRHWLGFRERREWPRRVIPDDWEQVEVEPDAAA